MSYFLVKSSNPVVFKLWGVTLRGAQIHDRRGAEPKEPEA